MHENMLIMLLVAVICLGVLYTKTKTEKFMPGMMMGMGYGFPPMPMYREMRVLYPAYGMPYPGMSGAVPMGGGSIVFTSWPPQEYTFGPYGPDGPYVPKGPNANDPRVRAMPNLLTNDDTMDDITDDTSAIADTTDSTPSAASASTSSATTTTTTTTEEKPAAAAAQTTTTTTTQAAPAPRTKLLEKNCVNASDPNNRIYSPNGLFALEVLKNGGLELWKIKTAFGTDHDGTAPLWSNGITGAESPDTRLCLEDDGKLAVYKSADKSQVLWTGSFADIAKFTEYGVFEGFTNSRHYHEYQQWEAFDATNPDYALVISDSGVLQETEDEKSIVWQAQKGDPPKGAVQNPKIPLNAGPIAKADRRTVLAAPGCMTAFAKDGNNRLYSPNGKFALEIAIDGTLAAWALDDAGNHVGEELWYSSKLGHERSVDHELCMQEDGNLVMYYDPHPKGTKKVPLWNSNTKGQKLSLFVTDTGRVEMKNAQNQIVWFADGSSPRTPDGINKGSIVELPKEDPVQPPKRVPGASPHIKGYWGVDGTDEESGIKALPIDKEWSTTGTFTSAASTGGVTVVMMAKFSTIQSLVGSMNIEIMRLKSAKGLNMSFMLTHIKQNDYKIAVTYRKTNIDNSVFHIFESDPLPLNYAKTHSLYIFRAGMTGINISQTFLAWNRGDENRVFSEWPSRLVEYTRTDFDGSKFDSVTFSPTPGTKLNFIGIYPLAIANEQLKDVFNDQFKKELENNATDHAALTSFEGETVENEKVPLSRFLANDKNYFLDLPDGEYDLTNKNNPDFLAYISNDKLDSHINSVVVSKYQEAWVCLPEKYQMQIGDCYSFNNMTYNNNKPTGEWFAPAEKTLNTFYKANVDEPDRRVNTIKIKRHGGAKNTDADLSTNYDDDHKKYCVKKPCDEMNGCKDAKFYFTCNKS